VLRLVDCVVLLLDCALRFLALASSAVHILDLYVFDSLLQQQVDTVIVEGLENVGEEDWIEIKTEEDCLRLLGGVKWVQEVSVLCWCFLWY
jgi:hypothetical protein